MGYSSEVDLGFDTVGNATLICHDRRPILVTDPWLTGPAYFGSWSLSHIIPAEQLRAIQSSEFVWLSHGHPDHLSFESLQQLRGKKILLPDHVGGRIRDGLLAEGFDVHVLRDRTWYRLSDRVRVLCVADLFQDGVLLVDMGGKLLANLNDATPHGWGRFVKQVIHRYPVSFLLHLSGYGDADMINLFDEDGRRIPPLAAQRNPVGAQISDLLRVFGARYFVPFSSMHQYQRADSLWANAHRTDLPDYRRGFDPASGELLPAYIRYDLTNDHVTELNPEPLPNVVRPPGDFGDDWNEPLEREDVDRVRAYFRSVTSLAKHYDFVAVRVGGQDHTIDLARGSFNRGLTFEVPRHSLLEAVQYSVFDDLLIGNFMRTTLHGKALREGLFPHFTPYVAKYADNGLAKSEAEVAAYCRAYQNRAQAEWLLFRLESTVREELKMLLPRDSGPWRLAKQAHRAVVARQTA